MDVDHAGPDVVFELGQPLVLPVDEVDVGGAVVEHVDASERSTVAATCARPARRDVTSTCIADRVAADRGCDGLGAVERDVGDDDLRALGRHRGGAGAPHARAAADDERHLASEPASPLLLCDLNGCQGRYWPSPGSARPPRRPRPRRPRRRARPVDRAPARAARDRERLAQDVVLHQVRRLLVARHAVGERQHDVMRRRRRDAELAVRVLADLQPLELGHPGEALEAGSEPTQ